MLNLFFPNCCKGCGAELITKEDGICSSCRHALPIAGFHAYGNTEMETLFYGRLPIKNGTALLYFTKNGLTQKFIHALKYKGQKELSATFGKWLGAELAECNAYQDIDCVIPVPLHKKKLRKRGYNQVEGFGKEIAAALEKPYVDDVLLKVSHTKSQVFKERLSRLFNPEEIFALNKPQTISGKHILLVDDIITTGATMEQCGKQLLQAPEVTLSIAAIAITH